MTMKKKILLYALVAMCMSCSQDVRVVAPTVEHQENPEALSTDKPRFSWKIESRKQDVLQESYRILVSSTKEALMRNEGDLWDSGVVNSDKSVFIPYGGRQLKSRDEAYWKVISTTNAGTGESEPAYFRLSILDPSELEGEWIGRDFDSDVLIGKTHVIPRYCRKEFGVAGKVRKATLYVSGLGLYEAFINGKEIGADEHLKPIVSDYSKTVYFNTFDVTDALEDGENAIGVILSGGRYTGLRIQRNPQKYGPEHFRHFGTPRLFLQLEIEYDNGDKDMVVSDNSWKITVNGPIRMGNLFDGERYNANMEMDGWDLAGYDDSAWQKAQVVKSPGGILRPQPAPGITAQDHVKPVDIVRKGETYILDMGQNMVGWLAVSIKGQQKGDTLQMRFAETLNADTTIYTENLRSAEVTDMYVSKDSETVEWRPAFTYHGFRYVEIKGMRQKPSLDDFVGEVIYDQMSVTGHFESSDTVMNRVYRNACWGIKGNYNGMPTDCPQRDERLGWNGDRTTGNYGEAYIFDNHLLYSKWLVDFQDSQKESGSLPEVVPNFWSRYSDSVTWPGAFVTVADMIYSQYGDPEPIIRHYDAMKKWLRYMKDTYGRNGIIDKDKYGDWCMPPESLELIHSKDPNRITAPGVLSTAFYYYLMGKMIAFAPVAGHPEDVEYFENEAKESKEAFNREYFNEKEGNYANNTVTANLLALYLGLVSEGREKDVFDSMVHKTEVDCDGHVSTGVIGIQFLMRTLTEFGRPDLALKIASSDTYPSWGYMVKNGATTIWELWNGNTAAPYMNSGNHVMLLGDLIIWYYEYLGGIRSLEPGFKKIQLKPYVIDGIDYINCSYDSMYGKIQSNWKRSGESFEWNISIPANTTATVCIPTENGYIEKEYGSGTYRIKSSL